MDATVTFSKEFKQKANKPLGNVEKRELRIQRLVEADKDGRLAKAKTRYDVGALAGFTRAQRTSGYLWTYHLIKDGILKEHIMNYTKDGHAEYEYHVSMPKKDEPYTVSGVAPESKLVAKEEPVILSRAYEPKAQTVTLTNVHPKATIKLAHIELVLEDMPLKDIAELVRTLDKEA
jgi:hypothetical protein